MKKLILIPLLIASLSVFGQYKMPDYLVHRDTTKALIFDNQINGGYKVVATKNQRNSISVDKRKIGGIVTWYESGVPKTYMYNGSDVQNINWTNDDNWLPVVPASYTSLQLTPTASVPYSEGLMYYDSDDKCLKYYVDNSDVSMDVGFENWVKVRNNTGGALTNGHAVYISGAIGQNPTVSLASCLNDNHVIGVLTHDLSHNETGYVTTFGVVRDLNTSMYDEGDELWLSTAGDYRTTKPQGDSLVIYIGVVLYSHNTQGKILVNVQQGVHLADLHDVYDGTPTLSNVLMGNGTKWTSVSSNDSLWKVGGNIGKSKFGTLSDVDLDIYRNNIEKMSFRTNYTEINNTLVQGQYETNIISGGQFNTILSGKADTTTNTSDYNTFIVTEGSKVIANSDQNIFLNSDSVTLTNCQDLTLINSDITDYSNKNRMVIIGGDSVRINSSVFIKRTGSTNALLLNDGEWDDLSFPSTTSKLGVNTNPDFDYTNNGLLFPENDTTEQIHIVAQMPHSWEYGTSIVPHVHWIQTTADDSCTWKIKYRIYNIGETVPTVWKTLNAKSGMETYTSGSLHQLSSFGAIDMTGKTKSCNIDIVLYRTNADTISGDVLMKYFDIHYRVDKFGDTIDYSH